MSKGNLIQNGYEIVKKEVVKNLPTILSNAAKGLAVGTVVATYKKAPDIHRVYHEKMDAVKALPKDAPLKDKAATWFDLAISVGKESALPVVLLVAEEACICGAEKEYKNRIALLGGALVASQIDKKELKEAAKEVVGKKKAAQIEEKAAEKKLARVMDPDDPTLFDDADESLDCIIMEENSGTVWRDNYLRVDKIIDRAYEQVHHNGKALRLDEFFGMLNEDRFTNKIRNRRTNNIWVYTPEKYYKVTCNDRDNFMALESAGFTPNGKKAFIIRSNPELSNDVYAGQLCDDATCSAGWNDNDIVSDGLPFYKSPDDYDTNETTILDAN